jgi:hypothetical protein
MMEELNHRSAFEDLAWLVQMVAMQQLKTSIELGASWQERCRDGVLVTLGVRKREASRLACFKA